MFENRECRYISLFRVKNNDVELYCLLCKEAVNDGKDYDFQIEVIPLAHIKPYGTFEELGRTGNGGWINKFQAILNKSQETCKFGPEGNIMLDYRLRGYGIGTYAFGTLIETLKSEGYGNYKVRDGKLSSVDAKNGNRVRRDAMYRNLGFTVEVDEEGNGKFYAEKVDVLWNDDSKKIKTEKLNIINLEDFIKEKIKNEIDCKSEIEKLKKTEKGLRETLEEKRDKDVSKCKFINRTTFGTGIVVGMILGYVLIQIGTYLGIYR